LAGPGSLRTANRRCASNLASCASFVWNPAFCTFARIERITGERHRAYHAVERHWRSAPKLMFLEGVF
jgi:hypothetical protein